MALSREQLAEKANISVQFLADIEKGRKSMTVLTLKKLSSALTVTPDYIINGVAEPNAGQNSELLELIRTLTPKEQYSVLKLIRVFLDAVRETEV